MRKRIAVLMVVGALLFTGGQVLAAESLVDEVKKACNTELTTFCKGVMPGEGRISLGKPRAKTPREWHA